MHDSCNHGPAEPTNAAAEAPQTGGPARRSVYWRSIEQLSDSPEFRAYMHNEFQPGASEASDDDRRTFIKVMGASFALAGLAATGCRRLPETKFAEYASRPANRTPGVPVTFATSFELGGVDSVCWQPAMTDAPSSLTAIRCIHRRRSLVVLRPLTLQIL